MTDEQPEGADAERPSDATQPGAASDATPKPAATPSPSSSEPPAERPGLLVPIWLAVALAVLLVFGLGFLIGRVAAPDGGHDGEVGIGRVGPGQNGGGPGDGGPFRGLPAVPRANQAFLGIGTAAATGGASGVQVTTVETGSPADRAGLKAGDVITAVDGTNVTSPQQLAERIHAHQPGDQVTIAYTRNGSSAQATVKLGTRAGLSVPSTLPQTPS